MGKSSKTVERVFKTMSRIVANILCHNDILYLKNLIPQVERFADRIIVVDDCSDDGTKVEETKTTYIEKGIYQIGDLNRRLEMDSTFLPTYIDYPLNNELRDYLCTNHMSRVNEFVW